MSIGGFSGGLGGSSTGNFGSNGPTMAQATQETMNAAANMPKDIADSMLFGLGISQWANQPQNQTQFDQPQFSQAYNSLFGPGVSQIGSAGNGNGNGNIQSILSALLSQLANNSNSSLI